jgi:hypothetical protein
MLLHEVPSTEARAALLSVEPDDWQPALVAVYCACQRLACKQVFPTICFHDDRTVQ